MTRKTPEEECRTAGEISAGADDGVITVVVVTYNSESLLGPCLRSLPSAMADVPFSVLVVDNGSTDRTHHVAGQAAPKAQWIPLAGNRGYAAAINVAISSCRGHMLVLNPDVRLEPGSVPRLLNALGQSVGIAAPRLVSTEGKLQLSLRREPTVWRALGEALLGGERAGRLSWLGETVSDPKQYERQQSADWATGAALLLSRRCIDAVGPWDESFFLYSEETDFALRARDLGLGLEYVPDAVAVHIGGESHERSDLWTLLTVNRVGAYRKRHGWAATAAFRTAVMLNEALRAPLSPIHRAALRTLLGNRRPVVAGAALLAAEPPAAQSS